MQPLDRAHARADGEIRGRRMIYSRIAPPDAMRATRRLHPGYEAGSSPFKSSTSLDAWPGTLRSHHVPDLAFILTLALRMAVTPRSW